METNVKVAAVVVLYNNDLEFKECIEGLKSQTKKIDYYYFIDNSTSEYSMNNKKMIEKNFIEEEYLYQILTNNIGSAGGFAIGMQMAYNAGFDIIWLNDQDGKPGKECLEVMLCKFANVGRHSIVIPNVLSKDNGNELKNFHCAINFFGGSYYNNNKIGTFGTTGVAIRREVIESIGVYNYRVFYIGSEDREYAFRAVKNNVSLYFSKEALYYHPDLNEKYGIRPKTSHRRFLPWNLGGMKKYIDDYRLEKILISNSYINIMYNNRCAVVVNYIYSILRILGDSNKSIIRTISCYKKGIELSKNINNKIYINDFREFINGDT